MKENKTVIYNYYGTPVEVTEEIKTYHEKNEKKMYNALVKRKLPSSYTKDKKLIHLKPLETNMGDLEAMNIQIPDKNSSDFDYRDLKVLIAEILNKLEKEEKEIIEMIYFYNMREREIADELGVYPNAIHYKKQKALSKIKTLLGGKNPLEA